MLSPATTCCCVLEQSAGAAEIRYCGAHAAEASHVVAHACRHCSTKHGNDVYQYMFLVLQRAAGGIELHTVAANPARPEQFTVGGEEEFAYVYDARMIRAHNNSASAHPVVPPLEQFCPQHMLSARTFSSTHITASCFSRTGELLVTYSNEQVYLFHPWLAGAAPKVRNPTAPQLRVLATPHLLFWYACTMNCAQPTISLPSHSQAVTSAFVAPT